MRFQEIKRCSIIKTDVWVYKNGNWNLELAVNEHLLF